MPNQYDISDTAFLVNESRVRQVEVSQDIYAHHWVTHETQQLWEDYSQNVYPYDDIEISIRNRFFLKNLDRFVRLHSNPVFINVGAGFTSYPFLIDSPCQFIEVDRQNIIEFKREKITQWQQESIFPQREIEYFAIDLNERSELNTFKDRLKNWISNQNSFILLEGLTYYLDRSIIEEIFTLTREYQTKDSMLAFDFWKPDITKTEVFQRQEQYFSQRFGYQNSSYTFLDPDFIQSLAQYQIVELTDVIEQEKLFNPKMTLNQDLNNVLFENYAALRKIN